VLKYASFHAGSAIYTCVIRPQADEAALSAFDLGP
jgi:hypothetical protein